MEHVLRLLCGPGRQGWNDARAVTTLEYGVIAAVIGTVIAVGFRTYGTALKNALAAIIV